MSDELEAARRDLHEALAVARTSLARVRGRPTATVGSSPGDTDRDAEIPDDDA